MYAPLKTDLVNIVKGSLAAIEECRRALNEFHSRFELSDHYIVAFYLLDSLASNCIRARDTGCMPDVIAQLKTLSPFAVQKGVSQKIQARIMFSEIALAIMTGEYEAGVKCLTEWMKTGNRESWTDAPLAYMNYLMGARIHYMNNEPDKSLDYLLMIRNGEKSFRASMLIAYQFLYLLCHYKLNNFSVVTSTAQSLYRSLSRHEKLYGPERALLRFVKKSGTVERMRFNLTELYETMQRLSNDPMNVSFFQYGDYLDWLRIEIQRQKKR